MDVYPWAANLINGQVKLLDELLQLKQRETSLQMGLLDLQKQHLGLRQEQMTQLLRHAPPQDLPMKPDPSIYSSLAPRNSQSYEEDPLWMLPAHLSTSMTPTLSLDHVRKNRREGGRSH
eukprot:GEMP01088442.1.p2 GENE.GEMP01088442.1~~GEMP01088442.1.p2  ORF type:complete len:119 (+),score=24.63 GEMP01088442.1:74-430(+)